MTRRGWCPSLFEPMQSGDGWLVRVKPFAATLTADGARILADAAQRFGNGVIELTNRGNVQVRGLTPGSARHFAAAMVAAGLALPDAEAERRRNVLVSPLAGDDPATAPNTLRLAARVALRLVTDSRFAALPDKFLLAVDGGGALPLYGVRADVRLLAGDGRWHVAVDDARDATSVAPPIGFLPYAGTTRGAFGFGLPFGQATGAALTTLATLAERHGDGTLRITPWRVALLAGVDVAQVERLRTGADGLIASFDDERVGVSACIGQPGCAAASVPTRADAAHLASARGVGTLHVSGCAKGCAHPGSARVTLVGRDGRYDLVRNGRAGDPPWASGLTVSQVAALLQRDAA